MERTKKRRGSRKGRQVDSGALSRVRRLLGDAPRRHDLLIEFLHRIQDEFGHLSAAHLVALGAELQMPPKLDLELSENPRRFLTWRISRFAITCERSLTTASHRANGRPSLRSSAEIWLFNLAISTHSPIPKGKAPLAGLNIRYR